MRSDRRQGAHKKMAKYLTRMVKKTEILTAQAKKGYVVSSADVVCKELIMDEYRDFIFSTKSKDIPTR